MPTNHHIRLSMEDTIDRLQISNQPDRNDLSSLSQRASSEWDLNTGYETAIAFAEFGWKEKAHEIEGYLLAVQDLVRDAWTTHLDVSGECVDIGAYLEGVPECMISYDVPERHAIKIVANISARANADAPRLLNRGIAIAAAVYALQCAGVPVSLSANDWVTPSRTRTRESVHSTSVEINPFGDYIDAGRLAFWLGHPAALRRCFFRLQEQEPEEIRNTYGFKSSSGYGYPIDPSSDDPSLEDAAYIPFPETKDLDLYQTPAKAFETIRGILAAQGVHVIQTRK